MKSLHCEYRYGNCVEFVRVFVDDAGNIFNVVHRDINVVLAFVRSIANIESLLTCIEHGIDPNAKPKPISKAAIAKLAKLA